MTPDRAPRDRHRLLKRFAAGYSFLVTSVFFERVFYRAFLTGFPREDSETLSALGRSSLRPQEEDLRAS